jgi:endonuclease/exonuclease/phosphatase family metal-dependent hydrolase
VHQTPTPTRTFTLQTWNVWYGGREVDHGQEKQYAIAAQYPADVLAMQECWGTAAENLAPKISAQKVQHGWDNAVLTTGEATAVMTQALPYGQAALITPVEGARTILVWSVHLAPYPYAAYRALAGEGQEVADTEEAPRLEQIRTILAETTRIAEEHGDPEMPVVIAGDFNTPSTGDWAARPDRPDIAWRAPDALIEAGFVDTFRAVHPDPATVPADTWSPIEPPTDTGDLPKPESGRTDGAEPRDRIDFIFARGLEVVTSVFRGCTAEGLVEDGFEDVGGRCLHIPDQRQNRFPSDHQMVETEFVLPA